MPYNMTSATNNEVKKMILDWLEELRRRDKERKALEEQFRQFEATLEGSKNEFKARSDYFSRQLVAADPVNGITQIISVAEYRGQDTVDLSFATEEMYQLIPEKDRPMMRKLVDAVNGKSLQEAWAALSIYASRDFDEALITRCKFLAEKMALSNPDSEEEKMELDALKNALFDPLSEEEQKELKALDEKTEFSEEESDRLNKLKTRGKCMDIFENADKPDYHRISEEELCNLYRVDHPRGITLEDYVKRHISFASVEERRAYDNMQANMRKQAVTQGDGRGDPDLFSRLSEEQRKQMSFLSKVRVAEQGVESAFQSVSQKMLKEIEASNKQYNLYERAGKHCGLKNKTIELTDELKELSVLTKDAAFLKKTVTSDLHEAWMENRASVAERQIRKNEQILADRQTGVKREEPKQEPAPKEEEQPVEEKPVENKTQADDTLKVQALTADEAISRDNKDKVRTFEHTAVDPATGEEKAVVEVETPKGNVLADSENFREMVNRIQERVTEALQPTEHKDIEGAGSTTLGTVSYMLHDVAETIDNGTLGAVADIATKTAVVAMCAANIKIDNALSGAEEFTRGLGEMLSQSRDVFEAFKAGKEEILNTALENDSELSLIRPSQDIKLISSLPEEMRNEAMPLANKSFEVLRQIAADDDLTARYCKANMDEIYEGQKSYMDLGVLAVMRNDEELLERLDADYRENFPEQFNNPNADFMQKVNQVANYLTTQYQKAELAQHDAFIESMPEPQDPMHEERGRELELERSLFDD